jgi:hypothetical protein
MAILHSLMAAISSIAALKKSFENPERAGWFVSGGAVVGVGSVRMVCLSRKVIEPLVRRTSDSISM